MRIRSLPLFILLGLTTLAVGLASAADVPAELQPGQRDVTAQNVALRGGVVSGTLVNQSKKTVSNIQLLITFTWLWKDERHPGTDNPGSSGSFTAPGPIAPGASLSFTYRPATALPQRTDGTFQPQVTVMGFAEVGAD